MHCTLNWIKSVPTNSNPTLPAFSDDFGITTKTSTHLADGHSKCAGSFSFVGGELDLGLRIAKGAWVSSRCPIFWVKHGCCDYDIHEFSQIIMGNIGNEGLSIRIISMYDKGSYTFLPGSASVGASTIGPAFSTTFRWSCGWDCLLWALVSLDCWMVVFGQDGGKRSRWVQILRF